MIPLSPPKAVFFDWDGTLADTFGFLASMHLQVMSDLKVKPPEDDGWFRNYFGKPRDYIYQSLYGSKATEAQVLFTRLTAQNQAEAVKPLAGAAELLDFLKSQGCVLGVVTNKRPDLADNEINQFGWKSYFSVVIGAGDAMEDKPSPMPIYKAIEKSDYGGNLSDLWFIGDTTADLAAANRAQVKTLLINTHNQVDLSQNKYKIDYVITSFDNFLSELRQIF